MIPSLFNSQQTHFNTGSTKTISNRIVNLKKLKTAILNNEEAIYEALYKDLKKNKVESFTTELGGVLAELDFFIKKLPTLSKPKRVGTPLVHFKASSKIIHEPLGIILVIAPWNYPIQLLFQPLIGAIAAGNCVIIKPSELAPAVAEVTQKIISEAFTTEFVAVVNGGINETQELLKLPFNYIFFTGSTAVGKIVYEAAAKNLIPVTLELGGKSPCIVDKETNLHLTAKRIAWGKFLNCGQTCIAPDYIFVHEAIKDAFIKELIQCIELFYSSDASKSADYGKIINSKHFDRIIGYLEGEKIIYGGKHNKDALFIEPTLVQAELNNSKAMLDELFGPVFPIIAYQNSSDVIAYINANPKPLALYVFSTNTGFQNQIINNTSSGGVCINDTLLQIANKNLPFGGVGASGIGAYHGKNSFDIFSHKKAVMNKSFLFDIKIRYAPHSDKKLGILKFLFRYFS